MKKDLGSCWTSKFNRSEQCVLVLVKINHIRKSADCGSKKVIIAICVALGRQHLEHRVWFCFPQRKRESEELDFVQQGVTNMITALQHKACKEVLRDQGLFLHREV